MIYTSRQSYLPHQHTLRFKPDQGNIARAAVSISVDGEIIFEFSCNVNIRVNYKQKRHYLHYYADWLPQFNYYLLLLCSHFSQLIHPHVRMLKQCQPLNAASAPTARRSWRWNCLSPWSAVPLPTPNCLPQVLGPPSSQRLALHKTKRNPGKVLKETLQSKGHYKVILSKENCISLRGWLQSPEPLNL